WNLSGASWVAAIGWPATWQAVESRPKSGNQVELCRRMYRCRGEASECVDIDHGRQRSGNLLRSIRKRFLWVLPIASMLLLTACGGGLDGAERPDGDTGTLP